MNILKRDGIKIERTESKIILKEKDKKVPNIEERVRKRVSEGKNRFRLFNLKGEGIEYRKELRDVETFLIGKKNDGGYFGGDKYIRNKTIITKKLGKAKDFGKYYTKFAVKIGMNEDIGEWDESKWREVRKAYQEKQEKRIKKKVGSIARSLENNTIESKNTVRTQLMNELKEDIIKNPGLVLSKIEEYIKEYKFPDFEKKVTDSGELLKGKSLYDLYKEHQLCLKGNQEIPRKDEASEDERRKYEEFRLIDAAIRTYLEKDKSSKYRFAPRKESNNEGNSNKGKNKYEVIDKYKKQFDKYGSDEGLEKYMKDMEEVIYLSVKNKILNHRVRKDRYDKIREGLGSKRELESKDLILARINDNMSNKLKYYSIEASNFRLRKLKKQISLHVAKGLAKEEVKEFKKSYLELRRLVNEKKVVRKEDNDSGEIKNIVDKMKRKYSAPYLVNLSEEITGVESTSPLILGHKNIKKIRDEEVLKKLELIQKMYEEDTEEILKEKDLRKFVKLNLEGGRLEDIDGKKIKGKYSFLLTESEVHENQKIGEFRNTMEHNKDISGKENNKYIDDELNKLRNSYVDNIVEGVFSTNVYKFIDFTDSENGMIDLLIPESEKIYLIPSFRKVVTKDVIKNEIFKDKVDIKWNGSERDLAVRRALQLVYENKFVQDIDFISGKFKEMYEKLEDEENNDEKVSRLRDMLDPYKGESSEAFIKYMAHVHDQYTEYLQKKDKLTDEQRKEVKGKSNILVKLNTIFRMIFEEYLEQNEMAKAVKQAIADKYEKYSDEKLITQKKLEGIKSSLLNKIGQRDSEDFPKGSREKQLNFIYLLKNLKEDSRNRLEHQMNRYLSDMKSLGKEELEFYPFSLKTEELLPIFKYFKNYKDNFIKYEFKKDQEKEIQSSLEVVFDKDALTHTMEINGNGNKTKFYLELVQDNGLDEFQFKTHINKLVNSLYYDRIKMFLKHPENKEYVIYREDIKSYILLNKSDKKTKFDQVKTLIQEKKGGKLEDLRSNVYEYKEYVDSNAKVHLYDLSECNRMINDVLAIMVKFNTNGYVGYYRKNFEKESEEVKRLKDTINTSIRNNIDTDLYLGKELKLVIGEDEKDEFEKISMIRNYFAHNHIYEAENKLSLIDYVNLTRFAASYDRKTKNIVTRAIINYFDKNDIIAEFAFEGHMVSDVTFESKKSLIMKKDIEKKYGEGEKLEYKDHSNYKMNMMKDLFKFKMEE